MKRYFFLLAICLVSFQNSKASTIPIGTIISSNLTVDQTWVNTNRGPWIISGSNITVTFGENFTISNTNQYFEITGTNVIINGADHVVTIDRISNFNGLVKASNANASSAEIKNIGVVSVNGSSLNGYAGYISFQDNRALISNCYSTGIISEYYSGGIVGANNSGTVKNCHSTGPISGNYLGGIAGIHNNNTIVNCYSTGIISGDQSGGISAYANYGQIKNCYSTGTISGNYSGGIFGSDEGNFGEISNCYSTGQITGQNSAGIVVSNKPNGKISNCYATGQITGANSVGICSSNLGSSIINCLYSPSSWNTTNANSVLIGVGTIWNISVSPYTLTLITSPPTLILTAPLARLTSNCQGINSPSTTFGIDGLGLAGDVILIAPSGFEISTVSNTSFVSSISIPRDETLYTVSSTVYIRITSSSVNGISGIITASSLGATNATTTVSSTTRAAPLFSVTGPYTICSEGTYAVSLTVANSYNGWSTSSPTISVNSSGYVTAGTVTGNYTVSYTDACAQTASATITVNNSDNSVTSIAGGQASYKINNTNPIPQGPTASLYVGYNGYNYFSATKPTNTGYYKANNQSGSSAGCPFPFQIFRCTTCPDPVGPR